MQAREELMVKSRRSRWNDRPSVNPPRRYPSGDRVVDRVEEAAPTMIKRFEMAFDLFKDRDWGFVLGVMLKRGILTETEAQAGMLYAKDVGAYERVTGHPPRSARSASYESGAKGAQEVDLEALRRMDPEAAAKLESRISARRRAIQGRYRKAQNLIPQSPILIGTVLDEVCCNDRPVNSLHHPMLKAILRRLAEHYGIEEARRRRRSRR